jgi:Na+:H+ antiporter, NhaA family
MQSELPSLPIHRVVAPIKRFMHIEASSGIVLLLAAIGALLCANIPAVASWYKAFWSIPITFAVSNLSITKDLLHLVNDGLMTIFFFVVGLEIKRELVTGELQNPRKALLPIVAALGGVIVPATIFYSCARMLPLSPDALRAWAIPMATDIAFVVGVMALFGSRIPFGLKIMMLSLAIVDDLIAIVVIATVFTEQLNWIALVGAGAALGLIKLMDIVGVRSIASYVVLGIVVWAGVFASGIHATIAGVVLGLMTPASALISREMLEQFVHELSQRFSGYLENLQGSSLRSMLVRTRFAFTEAISPLTRLEQGLHPWVAFVIMPLFAFANAGVLIEKSSLEDALTFVVGGSLLLGKPLGIMTFSFLAVRCRLAQLPHGVSWPLLLGCACLAGIGFTMAIFLATLSLPSDEIAAGKLGILIGSLASAIIGALIIWRTTMRSDVRSPVSLERDGSH